MNEHFSEIQCQKYWILFPKKVLKIDSTKGDSNEGLMQKAITPDKKLEEKDKMIEKKDKLLGKKDRKLCVQERKKEEKMAETVRIPHHA